MTSAELLAQAHPDWIHPEWPAPPNVRSLVTTRVGGFSEGAYSSMNLGDHVEDSAELVARNRECLARATGLDSENLFWLRQTHSTIVLEANDSTNAAPPEADASFTKVTGKACVVMTADCLPVLLCDQRGTQVAAVHAGWRGLLNGVLDETLAKFDKSTELLAYLGPAISQANFQVGGEVKEAFVASLPEHALAFKDDLREAGKYLADIYLLARQKLLNKGVTAVFGGAYCTYAEQARFFSYRRDGACTGRMASLIWLAN